MTTQVLTIFLIKDGVPNDKILDESRSPTATKIPVGAVTGTLYTISSPLNVPGWASFFAPAVDPTKLELHTASASAVLVVPMSNRTFALSFGYGRYMIDPMVVESTFGLRATLNSVSADSIRWIDKRTFEGISTHTLEQASKETSIGDFDLNVERDVVRAVTGTPSDATLGGQLTGKDSLTARCAATLDTLPEFLQAYYTKSQETSYKKNFPWIDNIVEIRDPARVQQLDDLLVEALKTGGNPKIWLAIPEVVNWSDVDGFYYSAAKSAAGHADVHITDYLDKVTANSISPERLNRDRIIGRRATDGQPFGKWRVYQCLHAEISDKGGTYLLNGGAWYQIDNDFVSTVDRAVSLIPTTDFIPIDYAEGEAEATYNKRLAGSIDGACCPDRDPILHGGGRSRVEFCDVYAPSRQMIHVKRYSGSSVLSHLFAQGLVSGSTFISDPTFREKVNALVPAPLRVSDPTTRPNAADYEIAFLVASRSKSSLALPFFSRVTLRHAYTQLTNFGFRVTLTKIQVT